MTATARSLIGFVLLAYLLSWLCWWPLVWLGPGGTISSPLKYLHLLGSLGPAVSGLAMAWITGRKEGLTELLGRIGRWRVSPLWHAFAWLSPFAVLAIAQTIASVFGTTRDGFLQRSTEYPSLSLTTYWVSVVIFYGFGEEVGWRGFALSTLQSRFHPAIATLIVTGVWALWHLPLFLFSPGLSSLGLSGSVGWLLSLLSGSFILTWLFNKARHSVLVAAGFHATMDIAFLGSPLVMTIVGIIITVVGIAAGLAVIFGPKSPEY